MPPGNQKPTPPASARAAAGATIVAPKIPTTTAARGAKPFLAIRVLRMSGPLTSIYENASHIVGLFCGSAPRAPHLFAAVALSPRNLLVPQMPQEARHRQKQR